MRAFLVLVLAMVVLCSCEPIFASDWEVSGLTDVGTSMAEVRVGHSYGKDWTIGLLGDYFTRDAEEPGKDWGLGTYAKLVVDPNASIPVANWLPKLGDWLGLPESMTAETYLIGKGLVLPYQGGGVDFAGAIGGGAQVGPVFGELIYDIVESGDADNPVLASGMTIWFGLCIEW